MYVQRVESGVIIQRKRIVRKFVDNGLCSFMDVNLITIEFSAYESIVLIPFNINGSISDRNDGDGGSGYLGKVIVPSPIITLEDFGLVCLYDS
ncbi:hypothetical protein D1872_265420 [compost metagenome]